MLQFVNLHWIVAPSPAHHVVLMTFSRHGKRGTCINSSKPTSPCVSIVATSNSRAFTYAWSPKRFSPARRSQRANSSTGIPSRYQQRPSRVDRHATKLSFCSPGVVEIHVNPLIIRHVAHLGSTKEPCAHLTIRLATIRNFERELRDATKVLKGWNIMKSYFPFVATRNRMGVHWTSARIFMASYKSYIPRAVHFLSNITCISLSSQIIEEATPYTQDAAFWGREGIGLYSIYLVTILT